MSTTQIQYTSSSTAAERPPHLFARAGNDLLVFRLDGVRRHGPQCVATIHLARGSRRCSYDLGQEYGGWDEIYIAGTEGSVEVIVSDLPDECFIRQRCRAHLESPDSDDLLKPEWTVFDPARDSDLIDRNYPFWTPSGITDAPRVYLTPVMPANVSDQSPSIQDEPEPGRMRPPVPTALYRWFDVADALLYVGISDGLSTRTGSHIKASSWMDFAARSTIERYPDRDEAKVAEKAAIKAEHPLFNHQHNDTPEARRRLVEYLLAQDRIDLLAPAVSRG